jgi:CBS domain-containing protein
MKVQEIMTRLPETCRPDDNLATAVELLWKADCSVLPITDHTGRVAGILTDRDICIALGTRNARAADTRVESVMRTVVYTCQPTEDVLTVLGRMADHKVRRLPVIDLDNRLVGLVSLNDAVLAAGRGRDAVRPAALLDAFKAVCAHRVPALVSQGAVASAPTLVDVKE